MEYGHKNNKDYWITKKLHESFDVTGGDGVAAKNEEALNYVLEFADIARPAALLKESDRFGCKGNGTAPGFSANLLREVLYELGNVFLAFV